MENIAVYIETYGCQMNKLDSENVAAILGESGFDVVEDIKAADVILLNTCGVRENAEMRIRGRVGELSSLRRERPRLAIGIIGCMAQRLGESLLSPVVKVVAGPDAYRRLPDMLRSLNSHGLADTALDTAEIYEDVVPVRSTPFSAWVAVMRGCNNFCSYCIVPYTRGRERSIPAHRVIRELEDLRAKGFREVTLLGQNVNSYRDGDTDFAELLVRAADTGMEWIRFLTSHPRDLNVRILEVMAARENICNHLHLPLQSGSDAILEAMNRRYTITRYLGLAEEARRIVPGVSLTTDLIFGFPGETEEDFRRTLSVMERVRFDFAFLYRYSEREGTKACDLPGSVPEEVRIERLKAAIELQNAITAEKNREQVGKIHTVLTKGPSKDRRGWYGFTETGVPTVYTTDDPSVLPGSFVKVRIESSTGASLVGRGIWQE
ncbi:MAG: tRNA (N6-isopentenyl adenosine(37)-C2)-methylthiotransferase MiaB [Candidatus Latescibacterota bacterium]